MIRILTFGVYDMLHIGHILLFKHAKEYFPDQECHLIVAVQDEKSVLRYKPEAKMVYDTNERVFMVQSVRYVDEVTVYKNVDEDIKKIDFDVFAKGPDQVHSGFQHAVDWCEKNGKKVVVIQRTEGISSSYLRKFSTTKK